MAYTLNMSCIIEKCREQHRTAAVIYILFYKTDILVSQNELYGGMIRQSRKTGWKGSWSNDSIKSLGTTIRVCRPSNVLRSWR
jgi:hypothetical protein